MEKPVTLTEEVLPETPQGKSTNYRKWLIPCLILLTLAGILYFVIQFNAGQTRRFQALDTINRYLKAASLGDIDKMKALYSSEGQTYNDKIDLLNLLDGGSTFLVYFEKVDDNLIDYEYSSDDGSTDRIRMEGRISYGPKGKGRFLAYLEESNGRWLLRNIELSTPE
ncbi:MAG TPA: hypothetical protein VH186_32515 [Chloroflexia bacterium]|nr:hypothetical protein [Chloroflexia bacterium]